MKSNKYQPRFYREWVKPCWLVSAKIIDKESDLSIYTDKKVNKDFVAGLLKRYRCQIEDYIVEDKDFLTTLVPLNVDRGAPSIVRRMSEASRLAKVGPMASVAGAISQFIGEDLIKAGFKEVIIENGGDIFINTSTKREIAVFAGDSKLSGKIILQVNPEDSPMGVCTSSGTVGHSLSFGNADAAVIMACDAILADAVATATCNQVKKKEDINLAIEFAKNIKGVDGVAIVFDETLAIFGKFILSSGNKA